MPFVNKEAYVLVILSIFLTLSLVAYFGTLIT
jgi:hypothetical protein